MGRPKLKTAAKAVGAYFAAPAQSIDFVSTGCKGLDCVLGGGWAIGRVGNIVGDKSTGKTLLAIEACANFKFRFPKGDILYREREFAFDLDYAQAVGLPVKDVQFDDTVATVEDFFRDVQSVCKAQKDILKERGKIEPVLYVLDSLDSLSDDAEMERDIDEGTFGAAKAKKLSEFFRKLIGDLSHARVMLLVISQVRDNIGATMGEKHSRSGGKALDFYASQVLWLAHMQTMKAQRKGVERPTGARIRAKCKKNKVGLPQRSFDFYIRYGFGLDDIKSHVEWLDDVKRLEDVGLTKGGMAKFFTSLDSMPDEEYRGWRARLSETVQEVWYDIEKDFMPSRRKYA